MKRLSTIDCHVAGQPLRLIVAGLPTISGTTMAERLAFARRRLDGLRRAVMLEPRGHRDMTGAILTDATSPGADAGVIFLDADGWRGVCGHGLIGAITIALEHDLLTTGRTDQLVTFDTAAGPVTARAAGGPTTRPSGKGQTSGARTRIQAVTFTAPPAIVVAPGVQLTLANRRVSADLARCSGLFAIIDAEHAGVALAAASWPRLRELAAEAFAQFPSAERPEGVVFTGLPHGDADLRAVTVYDGGCLDRSPSGLGLGALTAVLHDMGLASEDHDIRVEGAADLTMTARVVAQIDVDGRPAIRADVTGSAWITGEHTFVMDVSDPLAEGWPP